MQPHVAVSGVKHIMKSAARLAVLGLFALGLTACATPPQQDFSPPPSKRLDAKTTLENPRR